MELELRFKFTKIQCFNVSFNAILNQGKTGPAVNCCEL